jgi:hypothetical protein
VARVDELLLLGEEGVVVIRATDTQLVLSGSPAELRSIAMQFVQLKPGSRIRFAADETADPAPYDRLLVAFEVVASNEAVNVSVSDDTLLATGSTAKLAAFASFFQFEDRAPSGTHGHHEWFPGNKYIDPNSRPLVIRCT